MLVLSLNFFLQFWLIGGPIDVRNVEFVDHCKEIGGGGWLSRQWAKPPKTNIGRSVSETDRSGVHCFQSCPQVGEYCPENAWGWPPGLSHNYLTKLAVQASDLVQSSVLTSRVVDSVPAISELPPPPWGRRRDEMSCLQRRTELTTKTGDGEKQRTFLGWRILPCEYVRVWPPRLSRDYTKSSCWMLVSSSTSVKRNTNAASPELEVGTEVEAA